MDENYIDIHSHLNDPRFNDDRNDVLARMRSAHVSTIVVGTDRKMSEDAIALAETNPDIWATIGLHPTDNHIEDFDEVLYQKMAEHPRVVAIGECGLDYYWPEHDKWPIGEVEEKKRQRELFEKQIAIAKKVDKPLMIHGRPTKGSMDAYEDIIEILRGSDVHGNVHFFVGDVSIAKQFLDIGFTMSFTGVITFTHDYDEVIKYIPLSNIMSETDAPYVAPVPHRGERNEPAYVIETVKVIAGIRDESENKVRAEIMQNAERVFGVHIRD